MAIHYNCRHCGVKLGSIDESSVETARLGFDMLTEQERAEMINYTEAGDIHIKAICEDCHESLAKNPGYYENDYLIH
ncbi:anti-sigma-F factor Fin [Niallia taxi]|uniref:anti-sigma-F factor Fin n=1 Tax=Niallia taxi TaxID=2499688 RepID=UPI003D2688E8